MRDEIAQRRQQITKDKSEDQKAQLKRALGRIRGDFGRRRRTFKAALLKNPPAIPLWGVISSHPDTITFKTWTVQDVVKATEGLHGDVEVIDGDQVVLHCRLHDDVARIALHAPAGECKLSKRGAAALVADTANKLAGIEHHFGVNALGAHPRCTHHMDQSKPRNLKCFVQVLEDGERRIRWFCNDCSAPCEVQSPELQPASAFLPPAVFEEHNQIPDDYDTHLRDPLTPNDLLHIIRCLPRRKAPGPDLIPNELLRILPAGLLTHILTIINHALVEGVFPAWWKDVSVTLMTKKAPAENLSNQRPVALCNTVYKLFSIVVNARLTRAVEENAIIEPEQAGGRRHRGTTRPLQWLQWQLHDAQRRHRRLYALFIDTTNAFGSVAHKVLWSILKGYGFKPSEVDFLESIYGVAGSVLQVLSGRRRQSTRTPALTRGTSHPRSYGT